MPRRLIALVATLTIWPGLAQRTAPPNAPETILRSTAQEVLLDFIARDKHQRLVTDLRAEEVEILEDGVRQKVRSFQYRAGPDSPVGTSAPQAAGVRAAYNPLREINVVSLVFEGMSAQSRRQATGAAKDFLGAELSQDTYVGVFTLNSRLALLQQYTNNLSLLNQAVDRAATGAYQTFAKDMQSQVMQLNSLASGRGGFNAIQPGSAEEGGAISTTSHSDAAAAAVLRQMASLTIAILSNQAGNLSIEALQQLIRAQAQLPGRKTVVYFSEGLILPPEQAERFRALVSDANRANIAFYTVDASGLDTVSPERVSRATNWARGRVQRDTGAAAQPTNYQENLRSLAEDTGGFAIANTNDMRLPLRRVMEEARAHYEVAYAPESTNFDGHFRTIEIRSSRPGIRIQSRKGYFALPLLNGQGVAPFELAALNAMQGEPAPRAFEFHAAMLRFRSRDDGTECRAVFSVPSGALSFQEAPAGKFRVHVSFLGLVKDDQDQIVRKISRDLQFEAPRGRRAEFARGEATVTLPLSLPPGRYHMDAVAMDQEGQAASVRRIAFYVPAAGHMALSDLVFVRSVQPGAGERDATNPLDFAGGQVTPELKPAVAKSASAVENVYFVLYPSLGLETKPEVRIAIAHNGKLVTEARPSLPVAEADGSIRVLSQIGLGGLDSGPYEVQVTAAQGGATASSRAVIDIQ